MTNYVLGRINGALSILAIELVLISVLYCIFQSRKLRMTWLDWIIALPFGMALVIALGIDHFGDGMRFLTIAVWRQVFGGTAGMNNMQLWLVGIGSVISGLGMLLLIYVLTKEWFAWRVLALCAAPVAIYLAVGAFL